ncbi:hypothetical protein Afil01_12710 [Actinorhabdospora filicis]|uniref:Uncharacterized protein n=1 Tax=Actinorhabdospora filicis TaxID=1785913 RepID=A0A9W6SJ25_9ACTN|nr:hypothetical protein [Actinorhabdospora filicis]GLZ76464.1 hypothetical protein Afil01_12710 [Actinorhabdospora filicis]
MTTFYDWEDVRRKLFDEEELAGIEAGVAESVVAYHAARRPGARVDLGLTPCEPDREIDRRR